MPFSDLTGSDVGAAVARPRARTRATRARGVGSHERHPLSVGWQMTHCPRGHVSDPRAIVTLAGDWRPATVPGTVASALRSDGTWDTPDQRDFDAEEWWYRCEFDGPDESHGGARAVLVFEGLATVADVWLNDVHILTSRNMFVASEVEVSDLLAARNCLTLRFRALRDVLEALPRQPRARWRTRLVDDQRLRAVRTTLLGRIPGWTPRAAPVGPWRPITLEYRRMIDVESAEVHATLDGDDGVVTVSLDLRTISTAPIAATLVVGGQQTPLSVEPGPHGVTRVSGSLRLPAVDRWWPHTHGDQPLYAAQVCVDLGAHGSANIDFGRVGFRTLEVDRDDGQGFGLRLNGIPVFCRGACWTPLDVSRLLSDPAEYRAALTLARDAGMNTIRVGGTMVYETDDFHDACDELGIMVWQDWMLANMDYPASHPDFAASLEDESRQLLGRLHGHVSTVVLCGGSEVAQQAAMLGLTRERWQSALFEETLPSLAASLCPHAVYVPSSPWGGTHPFHANAGITHYYGVGAYLRPLADARTSGVRFTSECLGFANVPEPSTCALVPGGGTGAGHHPAWKMRVPRDAGASWDFEDVRDHYLEMLFGTSARLLRTTDVERYLALSRVVTGEVMARVLAEWRRPGSTCRGALVWFLRDLWTGAGWGVVDAHGHPKAAYYGLRRTLAPVALLASDEGLNGLYLHVMNDAARPLEGTLDVVLFRGERQVARADAAVTVSAHSSQSVHVDALLGGFLDTTYAYRFGTASHDVTVVRLRDAASAVLAETFHFPGDLPNTRVEDIGLAATAVAVAGGAYALTLRTQGFAQAIAIDADGFHAEDAYFHMAPGSERTIRLTPTYPARALAGHVWPLNALAGHVWPLNVNARTRIEVLG